MNEAMYRVLRQPLLHFLLLGAAIYAAFGFFAEKTEDHSPNTIRVTAGDIKWMTDSWEQKWRRPPTEQELLDMIRQHIRETALYHEALAMGLDKDDVIIRRRLVQKLEFLTQDLAAAVPPAEGEMKAYFDEHRDEFREPDTITLTHVFIDPDKRGDTTLAHAQAIKAKLAEMAGDVAENADELGDRFMLQSYFPQRTEAEIGKLFGARFARSVFELTPGEWHGPVQSGYGAHVVFVHALHNPPQPQFAAVEERVRQSWEDRRREDFNQQLTDNLLSRYEVIVELEDETGNREEIAVPVGATAGNSRVESGAR